MNTSNLLELLQNSRSNPSRSMIAILKYGSVQVMNKDDASALWNKGFFGNGQMFEMKNEEKDNDMPLFLCLEEAFFLAFSVHILDVYENNVMLDTRTLWKRFSSIDPKFIIQYIVYQHFRKNWIVKSGLKFGSDWCLYPGGPPFFHSEYLVHVRCLWEDTWENDLTTFFPPRMDKSCDISAMVRLSKNVGKTALLCQVLRPRSVTDSCLMDVECITKFKITEISFERWNPASDEKPTPTASSSSQ